jgi:CRISPR-associated protein Cas2
MVAYDICEPKRLRQVFKIMNDFGDHIQLSVFLCELNPRERIQLDSKLRNVIKHTEDQVLIINLGKADKNIDSFMDSLGRGFVLPVRIVVV